MNPPAQAAKDNRACRTISTTLARRERFQSGKRNLQIQRRFLPKTFHTCFLVCMVWYKTLLPIIWRTYDFTVMETRDVPRHIVERYSFHFRHFSSCGGHDGPFHCTLLETLLLSHDHSYCPKPAKNRGTVQRRRELLKAKADINMSLKAEDFEMLSDLQGLTLAKWDGSNEALIEVLRRVGRTVKELEIRDLYGFKKSDVTTSTTLASDGAVVVRGGRGGEEVGTGPVLPRVKVLKLSCFTKTSDLGYIAGCCPDLEATSRLLGDNHGVDEGEGSEYGGAISTLIRGCSLSGLVRIKFETGLLDPTDMDVLRSVLVHSTTLEHLKIDFNEEQYQELEPMDIFQVLIQCPRLKTFSISGWTGKSLSATLKLLKSQPWGCLELEAFSLYIPCSLSDESDDEYEFEDDEYVFEDDDDEGIGPLMFLSLNSITYTRPSDPQIMEILDDFYDL
ncbi:MAG: hypothetical protein J3R72DRAFT_493325 [Linnemannia gamsii]|nr:MAG: hypothetical protein J3R72DRAFT_493325 [Linnemannia gamsii]